MGVGEQLEVTEGTVKRGGEKVMEECRKVTGRERERQEGEDGRERQLQGVGVEERRKRG